MENHWSFVMVNTVDFCEITEVIHQGYKILVIFQVHTKYLIGESPIHVSNVIYLRLGYWDNRLRVKIRTALSTSILIG